MCDYDSLLPFVTLYRSQNAKETQIRSIKKVFVFFSRMDDRGFQTERKNIMCACRTESGGERCLRLEKRTKKCIYEKK